MSVHMESDASTDARVQRPCTTQKESPAMRNSAVVFIKPHASGNDAVKDFVQSQLQLVPTMSIIATLDIVGRRIDGKNVIDKHYHAISSKATLQSPASMPNFPVEKFEKFFKGERWSNVVSNKRIVNANEALDVMKCTPKELAQAWYDAEAKNKVVKLGGGFYCGQLPKNGNTDNASLYVINGFYMAMREKFVKSDIVIHGYEIEWDPSHLSWAMFRSNILGATDPQKAAVGSIRKEMLDRYKELGLSAEPNITDNGVHASASPLEALAEKVNWMDRDVKSDKFGRSLVTQGLTDHLLKDEFFLDPLVKIPPGGSTAPKQSLFETVEDMDAQPCLEMLIAIYDIQLDEATKEGSGCTCSLLGGS